MDITTKWRVTGIQYIGSSSYNGGSTWRVNWERIFETGGHPTKIKERDYYPVEDALGALVRHREEMARRHYLLENEIIEGERCQ